MQADKTPLLSVIVPAYNTSEFIGQTIQSILKQTFQDFELLIIDDGSTDDTVAVVKRFADKRVRLFAQKKNTGKVEATNEAFKHASGEFVNIHDSDDYSHPQRFEKQINFLLENPDYALCGTFFYEMDAEGTVNNQMRMETDYTNIKKNLLQESQFHGPTTVFRREVVSEVGGLYRDLKYMEDTDLAMRIAERYKATNLNEYLYYYRIRPRGFSKNNFNFLHFEGMMILRHLAKQRQENGADCLMLNNREEWKEMLSHYEKPYLDDPALIYRKSTALSVYFKFWPNAFSYSIRALLARPFNWINHKELLYVCKVYFKEMFFSRL